MQIKLSEPMSRHTTFGVGGPAKMFVVPDSVDEAADLIRRFRNQRIPTFVIGNGSNLLVSDDGYDGIVVSLKGLDGIQADGEVLACEAGATLRRSARVACERSMSGLEFASGIPGSVGGACAMNAGAYGRCMADVVESVDALDTRGHIITFGADELGFRYRGSRILSDGLVVLRARMRLRHGEPSGIQQRIVEYDRRRRESQPVGIRSAGSTFKRPEGDFAGRLIDEAGLKGYAVGGACVSEKHAGFVVNTGGATASDIHAVIDHVTDEVERRFGVRLEPEVQFLS